MPLHAPRAHVCTRARPHFSTKLPSTISVAYCLAVASAFHARKLPTYMLGAVVMAVYGQCDPFVGTFQSHSCYIHAFSTPEISESHFVVSFQYDVATSRYV